MSESVFSAETGGRGGGAVSVCGLPSRIATMRPKMVAPGEWKESLKAVPSTGQPGQSGYWMGMLREGERERSTQTSHEAIIEPNLEEAQGGDASHTREQCVTTQFHHVERVEMKANVAATIKAVAQR
jgi:hypothetical protein